MNDNINPSHYKQGEVECIEAIKASMSKVEFLGYLQGNTMKYLWRYRDKHKNHIEDVEKAMWYMNRLKDENILDIQQNKPKTL